jgi:hypothetical protein
MDNARITYFGSGTLSLQMIRFPSGKELVCRLDNILGPERLKHRDGLLVVGMDGRLINVGVYVPTEAFEKAWAENKVIDDGHTGFMVVPPDGFCIVDEGPYLCLAKANANRDCITREILEKAISEMPTKFKQIDVAALKAKIDAEGPMEVRMPLTRVVPENIVTVKDIQEDETVVIPPAEPVKWQPEKQPKHGSKKQRGKRVKGEEGVPQDLLEAI